MCSGFRACAHNARIVQVDVAVGQRDLRAGPRDMEAAALPEKRSSLSEGSRKQSANIGALNQGKGRDVLRFGSPLGLVRMYDARFQKAQGKRFHASGAESGIGGWHAERVSRGSTYCPGRFAVGDVKPNQSHFAAGDVEHAS